MFRERFLISEFIKGRSEEMKRYFKPTMIVGFLTILLILICLPVSAATTVNLSLASGNPLGGFYPIGVGVSELVAKYNPHIQITSQVTAASTENLRLVSNGKVDLAMLSGSAIYDYDDKQELKKVDLAGFLSMWSVGAADNFIVARKGSGIKTVYDLKGKVVGVGSPGSGTEKKWNHILAAHGLTHDDMKAQYLSHTEAADAIKDGRIDAECVAITGRPAPSVLDMSNARDLDFVGVAEEAVPKLIDLGYYQEGILPANTYKGQNEDILIVQDFGVFVAREGLDEEIVYTIIKTVFEHLDELAEMVPRTKGQTEMTRAIESMVPLHPGANKYYTEKDM